MIVHSESFTEKLNLDANYPNKGSEAALKFLQVLDRLNVYKSDWLYNLVASKNAIYYKNILHLKREISEGSYLRLASFMSLIICECLYLNLDFIFRHKGTLLGATRFYKCLSQGQVSIDISQLYLKPDYYILTGSEYGVSESIANAQIQEEADIETGIFRYLFDNSSSERKNRIVLRFRTRLFSNQEFLAYVRYTVPFMFPHISEATEIIIEALDI